MADTTQRLLKLNVSLNPRGYRVHDGPVLPSYDAAGDLGPDYVFIETIRRYHGEGGETFPYCIMVELKETETELAHELERVMRLADESRIKARNMVKGWPRGRSTSQPVAQGTVWPWTYAYCLLSGAFLGEFSGPGLIGLKRRPPTPPVEELEAERAEERRKADMMDVWYEQKRMEARGKLRPQTIGEALMSHMPGIIEW